MQDSFQVVDQKQIIRKAKDRHIFLFEMYLVFCKDVKDTNGKAKYIYKAKFLVSWCTILKLFFHIVWQIVLKEEGEDGWTRLTEVIEMSKEDWAAQVDDECGAEEGSDLVA